MCMQGIIISTCLYVLLHIYIYTFPLRVRECGTYVQRAVHVEFSPRLHQDTEAYIYHIIISAAIFSLKICEKYSVT